MPPLVTLCTEIQPTLVFIECCHPTTFTDKAVCAIQLGKQRQSHLFATRSASTHSRKPFTNMPTLSNCQLNLARGYITSRGPHVHGFPAVSSEHLRLHQQNFTQAQCQDGRHPTKKPSYFLVKDDLHLVTRH